MKDAITPPAWFLPEERVHNRYWDLVSDCFSTPFAALTEISCQFFLKSQEIMQCRFLEKTQSNASFRLQLTELV